MRYQPCDKRTLHNLDLHNWHGFNLFCFSFTNLLRPPDEAAAAKASKTSPGQPKSGRFTVHSLAGMGTSLLQNPKGKHEFLLALTALPLKAHFSMTLHALTLHLFS